MMFVVKRGIKKNSFGEKHNFDILNWNARSESEEPSHKGSLWDNILSHSSMAEKEKINLRSFKMD